MGVVRITWACECNGTKTKQSEEGVSPEKRKMSTPTQIATRYDNPVSILYKSIAGRYRPVKVADGPITARYRFIKNANWERTRHHKNAEGI